MSTKENHAIAEGTGTIAAPHEQQKDPRYSVYVAARLTAQGRTQDCMILNVSAGGTKVSAAAVMPRDSEVMLVIGDSDSLQARVAWCAGGEMGLEFVGDRARAARLVWEFLDNPATGSERRRHTRTSVLWSGSLHVGGRGTPCRILNISAYGAKVRALQPIGKVAKLSVMIDRFGELPGEAVWQDGDFLGISFKDDPEDIAQILGGLLPSLRRSGA